MLAKFAKLIAGFLLVSGLAVCDPCNGQGVAMQFVPQERVLNLPVRIQYEIPEIVQYANLAGAYSAPCGTSSYAYGAGAYSRPSVRAPTRRAIRRRSVRMATTRI